MSIITKLTFYFLTCIFAKIGCMETYSAEHSILERNKQKYLLPQLNNIHRQSISTKAISGILLITSVLERSLGDILTSFSLLNGKSNAKVNNYFHGLDNRGPYIHL